MQSSVVHHTSLRRMADIIVLMSAMFPSLNLLLMIFASWVNRHQLGAIEYLQEENRVLSKIENVFLKRVMSKKGNVIVRRLRGGRSSAFRRDVGAALWEH